MQLLEETYQEEKVEDQIRVVTYELGDLVKSIHYAWRFPELRRPYLMEAKRALADLLVQLLITCKHLGFTVDEILQLGLQAAKESKLGKEVHGG